MLPGQDAEGLILVLVLEANILVLEASLLPLGGRGWHVQALLHRLGARRVQALCRRVHGVVPRLLPTDFPAREGSSEQAPLQAPSVERRLEANRAARAGHGSLGRETLPAGTVPAGHPVQAVAVVVVVVVIVVGLSMGSGPDDRWSTEIRLTTAVGGYLGRPPAGDRIGFRLALRRLSDAASATEALRHLAVVAVDPVRKKGAEMDQASPQLVEPPC